MNTRALAIIVTCSMLVIASCRKPDSPHIPCPKEKDKCFLLRKIETPYSIYSFHYDQAGLLDSMSAISADFAPYVVRLVRNGKRIDSISKVEDGELRWTIRDILYDDKERITRYTLYGRHEHEPIGGSPVFITYGPDGNIATKGRDTLTFNQQNDLVRWSRPAMAPSTHIVGTFTHDSGLNPLYCIDNLFLILHDPFIPESLYYSQHNSTRVVWVSHPDLSTYVDNYENIYDDSTRIVQKFLPPIPGFEEDYSLYYVY
jgi:hypothetical protein